MSVLPLPQMLRDRQSILNAPESNKIMRSNRHTASTSTSTALIGTIAVILLGSVGNLLAWDHPGHMTTGAIAFNEVKRMRPELLEKLSVILMSHPNPTAFSVAIGDTRGEERAKRLLMFTARWPDDAKFTFWDKPTWHTARWPILAEEAPPEARAEVERRGDKPVGQALKAAELNFAVISNSEANVNDFAFALCWVFHIVGDIHNPLHCSDYYSKEFPTGNAAGTMSYVRDPFKGGKSSIPLHRLWDSNTLRSTETKDIEENAEKFVKKYPRSEFPELKTDEIESGIFENWLGKVTRWQPISSTRGSRRPPIRPRIRMPTP